MLLPAHAKLPGAHRLPSPVACAVLCAGTGSNYTEPDGPPTPPAPPGTSGPVYQRRKPPSPPPATGSGIDAPPSPSSGGFAPPGGIVNGNAPPGSITGQDGGERAPHSTYLLLPVIPLVVLPPTMPMRMPTSGLSLLPLPCALCRPLCRHWQQLHRTSWPAHATRAPWHFWAWVSAQEAALSTTGDR